MLVGLAFDDDFYRVIIECADDDSVELQCRGLEKDVLRRMSHFDVDIANTPFTVFSSSPFVYGGKNQHGRTFFYP